MTGALRSCLRGALEAAREEGTVSVRVRHVARTLVELPDTRAREALVLEKLDIAAAAAALDALRGGRGAGARSGAADAQGGDVREER